jgi:hypothetical protein
MGLPRPLNGHALSPCIKNEGGPTQTKMIKTKRIKVKMKVEAIFHGSAN